MTQCAVLRLTTAHHARTHARSGYLVSQQQLRQRLMQIEWEGSLKLWAQRKGVADFEAYLAEKAEEQGLHVDWSLLQVGGGRAHRGRRGGSMPDPRPRPAQLVPASA